MKKNLIIDLFVVFLQRELRETKKKIKALKELTKESTAQGDFYVITNKKRNIYIGFVNGSFKITKNLGNICLFSSMSADDIMIDFKNLTKVKIEDFTNKKTPIYRNRAEVINYLINKLNK